MYSQCGEDDKLVEIFGRIGRTNRWCVDVGASEGPDLSNVWRFLEEGWNGVLIEQDQEKLQKCYAKTEPFEGRVIGIRAKVDTGQNKVDEILRGINGMPTTFDLMSLDIDGQEYHVWEAMKLYQPRVMVVEYSPYDIAKDDWVPPVDGEGQAGAAAMRRLAKAKGYEVIEQTKYNLICVLKAIADLT